MDRSARQRKRTNSGSRAEYAVRSLSSNELDGEMVQAKLMDRQAHEEMDCGENVHSTGRKGKVREGECVVWDDAPPMQEVKRVRNAEEHVAKTA